MNARTDEATPNYFQIPAPLTEKITTQNFGTVTVCAPSPAVIERIIGAFNAGSEQADDKAKVRTKPKDEDAPYRELVAECASGAHGERFTPDLLAHLPGQCFGDWVALRAAAIRVCGMNRDEVGKV